MLLKLLQLLVSLLLKHLQQAMAAQMDDMQAVAAWRRQEAERIERNRQAGAEWDNQQPMRKHELVFCLSTQMSEDQSENFR